MSVSSSAEELRELEILRKDGSPSKHAVRIDGHNKAEINPWRKPWRPQASAPSAAEKGAIE